MQPQTFVFFGQVGSGKGTQIKLLTEFLKNKNGLETVYAGTGEGFRQLINSGEYTGELVNELVSHGVLVPDFLTNAVFINVLVSQLSTEKYLIADGYPRTVAQSKVFEEIMSFFRRDKVNIIYIELSEAEAMKRNLLRGRADDTKEGLAKRFEEYVNNVVPAMNYFKDKKNYEIYTINGEQSVEAVHQDIIKSLGY
jgi:adenylate kinase